MKKITTETDKLKLQLCASVLKLYQEGKIPFGEFQYRVKNIYVAHAKAAWSDLEAARQDGEAWAYDRRESKKRSYSKRELLHMAVQDFKAEKLTTAELVKTCRRIYAKFAHDDGITKPQAEVMGENFARAVPPALKNGVTHSSLLEPVEPCNMSEYTARQKVKFGKGQQESGSPRKRMRLKNKTYKIAVIRGDKIKSAAKISRNKLLNLHGVHIYE